MVHINAIRGGLPKNRVTWFLHKRAARMLVITRGKKAMLTPLDDSKIWVTKVG